MESRHQDDVVVLALPEEGVTLAALHGKTGLLVGTFGARVEREELQADAVDAAFERVGHHQPCGLGAGSHGRTPTALLARCGTRSCCRCPDR